jgi:MoxR-like ATPase
MDPSQIAEKIKEQSSFIQEVQNELSKKVVGQQYLIERLMIGLLTGGHVLVEGLPGLAKTTTIATLSQCLHATFHRIQFTPDLLPADVLGTLVYNPKTAEFTVKKGPIFANIILADEINRAPAKVQSAMLEAMQEKQVSLGDQTYPLQEPFLVMATQNPVEQEGTYPLPEAQIDRFMLKVKIEYPDRDAEKAILEKVTEDRPQEVKAVVTPEMIAEARELVSTIYMDDKVKEYILDLVFATRNPSEYQLEMEGLLEYGASPRATIALAQAARAMAFLKGRGFVTPQDVKNIAHDVLRHRMHITFEAEAEGLDEDQLVQRLLDKLPVP